MSISALPVATLVIYIILLQPTLFVLWKHGKAGLLGWTLLQLFCMVRIAGAIIEIHNDATHSTSFDGLLVNNIGLSPLLLATAGVLHEARNARDPNIQSRIEWTKAIMYHIFVMGSMVLVIIGVVHEMSETVPTANGLMKVGVILLLGAFGVLVSWTFMSTQQAKQNTMDAPAYQEGTILLYAVLLVLPFVGIRDVYAVLSVFIKSPSFKNSLAAKVCLSTVPEMILTTVLVAAGVKTRHIVTLVRKN